MIFQLPGAMLRFADYQREFRYDSPTLSSALESLEDHPRATVIEQFEAAV